jgi:ribonucleoside-diphosphate reductase alpha chain
MLGISGGIEPVFANSYTRKTESLHGEDRYYKVYTPIVDKYM